VSKEGSSGLVFVAFMFIGMGVGYLLGNTAAGLFIGMGVGFLAMAYLKPREKEIDLRKEPWGSVILALVGLGFIFGGASLLLGFEVPWDKLGGIFLMLMGLAFLAMALGKRS